MQTLIYQKQRKWSDDYANEIRRIVGFYLLQKATDEQDNTEASDFVFNVCFKSVAARLRKPGYFDRYPTEFTIRCALPSGNKTEYAKIMDGHADLMFYGHVCPEYKSIWKWYLLDLHVFRREVKSGENLTIRPKEQKNPYTGEVFLAYDIRTFPSNFVIAKEI